MGDGLQLAAFVRPRQSFTEDAPSAPGLIVDELSVFDTKRKVLAIEAWRKYPDTTDGLRVSDAASTQRGHHRGLKQHHVLILFILADA